MTPKTKGRPVKREAEKLKTRQLRFTDQQWSDVKTIGGARRVRALVEKDARAKRNRDALAEVKGLDRARVL